MTDFMQDDRRLHMRAVRFTVNWLLFITLPVWGGTLLAGGLGMEWIEGRTPVRRAATGKEWLFK